MDRHHPTWRVLFFEDAALFPKGGCRTLVEPTSDAALNGATTCEPFSTLPRLPRRNSLLTQLPWRLDSCDPLSDQVAAYTADDHAALTPWSMPAKREP